MCVGRLAVSFLFSALLVAVPASAQAPPEATTPITIASSVVHRAGGCDSAGSIVVGAEDRNLAVRIDDSTAEELFASFGAVAHATRRVHDASDNETAEGLNQQLLADRATVEPARRLAGQAACAARTDLLYRFAYASPSPQGEDTPPLPSSVSTLSTDPESSPPPTH